MVYLNVALIVCIHMEVYRIECDFIVIYFDVYDG